MKTSSLTSTKPPTAVMMPRASSASRTRLLQRAERARGRRQVRGVGRGSGEAVDQPRGGVVRVAQFVSRRGKLRARILGHEPGIGLADAPLGLETGDRRPFGDDRMRVLERGKLLV